MASRGATFRVSSDDVVEYRGYLISPEILDAIIDTRKRVLWAFVKNAEGSIQSHCYTESDCIWMEEKDVLQAEDVEL